MAKKTGNFGYVECDGFTLHVTKWSFDHKAEVEDSTTTEDVGYQNVEPVLESGDGEVSCIFDTTAVPTAASPGLKGGKTISVMKLYIGPVADNRYIQCAALVKNLAVESPVKGLIKYNFTFTTKGAITLPAS